MKKILVVLLTSLFATVAQADVQVRLKDASGDISSFSSNGKKTRIESERMPGYAIIDAAEGSFLMVDPERNEIMRSDLGASEAVAGGNIAVELKDKGGGQKIAGYSTRKYEVVAAGESCGFVYASSELMKKNAMRAMYDSMRSMQRHSRGLAGAMGGFMSNCQRANLALANAMGSRGLPLKVVDAAGKVQSEVLEIDFAKKFDPGHYQTPAGMTVVDMNQRMNEAAQQTGEMMQQLPDMNQLMEQMQQGGGQMTEEMQQQMEQMMKQLQQLQQQSQ